MDKLYQLNVSGIFLLISLAAVKRAEALGVDLPGLPLAELQALCQGITPEVFDVLTPAASAGSRRSFGGTAPDQVRQQAALWRERLS